MPTPDEQTQAGAPPLRYNIDERPRPLEAVLYGWQHTLVDISPFILPLPIAAAMGLAAADSAAFINFGLVAMGLATLLQTTIGNRLPIVQGPSATFVGTMVPLAAKAGVPAVWGGIFIGGLIEAIAGGARIVGLLRRFLPKRVCGTLIAVIGLSLGHLALRLSVGGGSGVEVGLAVAVIAMVFALQALPTVIRSGSPATRRVIGLLSGGSIFFAIWTVGLGVGGGLGRVDWQLVADKPWFALPKLFPFGGPGFGWEFGLAAILVILVGYLASMVESIGDYAATCTVTDTDYTERHMNRGIFAEGLGGMLCSVLGAVPCTSYTQNVGIIATTRVASRAVVQVAAVILMLYGLCPKFGALLVAMPRSVLGGVFIIVCGMIVASGLRLLQSTEPDPTDGWVIGMTMVISLALPPLAQSAAMADQLAALPLAVTLLLTNSIVLAVMLGIVLEQLARLVGQHQPGAG